MNLARTLGLLALTFAPLACTGTVDVAHGGHGGAGTTGMGGATTGTGGAPACIPGAMEACTCPEGGSGTSICAADGSGFGACTGCDAWSARYGAAGTDSVILHAPAVLGDGSVVVPIHVQTGNGPGTMHTSLLRRYDAHGAVLWDLPAGGVVVRALARDAADRLVLAGWMLPGSYAFLGTNIACTAQECCGIIGRIDAAGTLAWAKVVAPATGKCAEPIDVAVTADGRIAAAGEFGGTLDLGCGPLVATDPLTHPSAFVARFSPEGECAWSRAFHGSGGNLGQNETVAVDETGAVALTIPLALGVQAIDLGAGPVPVDTTMGWGFALAKLSPDGDLTFAKIASGGSAGQSTPVALTGSGALLVSGSYDGTLDLGGGPMGAPGAMRYFVTKLGPSGEHLWSETVAVEEPPPPFATVSFELSVDATEAFRLARYAVPGMKVLGTEIADGRLVVVDHDSTGNPTHLWQFPLTDSALTGGLARAADGAPVVAGTFNGTIDFGQGALTAEGTRDAFVAKLSP
jgi:hypothetical protein